MIRHFEGYSKARLRVHSATATSGASSRDWIFVGNEVHLLGAFAPVESEIGLILTKTKRRYLSSVMHC